MKNFIVFGANGFIGSSIVDELSKDSVVYAVDRYSKKTIFKTNKNIKLVKSDLKNDFILEKKENYSGVVWAVGGGVPTDTTDNQEIIELIKPTIKALEFFMREKTPIILISSAGMLYKPQKKSLNENSLVEPWTWYGLQKLIIERALLILSNEHKDKDFTIFRVTSVYGERQPTDRSQGVIGKLIKSSLSGKAFPLYGSTSSRRDYVYVKDLAKVIKEALKKRLKYNIYNVSSGNSTSIAELKGFIESITKKKIKFDRKARREVDPINIDVSNQRLLKETGDIKFTQIIQGLEYTVDWFKENSSASSGK